MAMLLLLLSLCLLGHATASSSAATGAASLSPATLTDDIPAADRSSFPEGFLFGSASASYQVEGAVAEGGKGPTNWDAYTAKHPERIADRSNGDVAVDAYHRYKEDIAMMKSLGFNSYRFSLSWARILPKGTVSGGVNEEGIAYYNNFINELLANGIKPFVTILHFDVPEALETEYGGFLSRKIVKDFVAYADVCFKHFGDRVQHWITINEPLSLSLFGYAQGTLAPGRCSKWMNLNCTGGGDSAVEPYIVGHHQLLSHGFTVKLYREKYQAKQKGVIGTAQVIQWLLPLTNSTKDVQAPQRRIDFTLGWFQDPLLTGDYPPSMRKYVGERLPIFTKAESELLKGSSDFVGLNYYTSYYAFDAPPSNNKLKSAMTDSQTSFTPEKNGVPIGQQAGIAWQFIYPKGIRDAVLYAKEKYNNLPIYITENGMGELKNDSLSFKEALNDTLRVNFHQQHIAYLSRAIKEGANVKGYFAWSVMDNFEWAEGYTIRFGINYVDYKNGLKRYPKESAIWFRNFLKNP